jgi:hypothetical protein
MPVRAKNQGLGQPGLHSKILFSKTTTIINEKRK